jgi:ADP-ribosylglycohydrolase
MTFDEFQGRITGAVLGAAIGDAMGHPTEFLSVSQIHEKWGPEGVQGFELLWERKGEPAFAPYTDDTQMAEQVLRGLVLHRGSVPELMEDLAQRFVEWSRRPQGGHRAPGGACLAGCAALARGEPWSTAGGLKAGGCGSVLRSYPFGLVFAATPSVAEAWAVAHSALTHRDPIALASCAAMAVGTALLLRGESVVHATSEMVAAACRYSPKTAAMIAQAIEEARDGTEPDETLDRLRGWSAHEAIAAAVYVVERHPNDIRAAILEGANTSGDSDSIATLAGALLGARLGIAALPSEWVEQVERSAELHCLALEAGKVALR